MHTGLFDTATPRVLVRLCLALACVGFPATSVTHGGEPPGAKRAAPAKVPPPIAAIPASPRIVIGPVDGAPASWNLGRRVTDALRRRDIPVARGAKANKPVRVHGRIDGRVDAAGDHQLTFRWRLVDGSGETLGRVVQMTVVPQGALATPTADLLDGFAAAAAEDIAPILARSLPKTEPSGGWATVAPLTKQPGEPPANGATVRVDRRTDTAGRDAAKVKTGTAAAAKPKTAAPAAAAATPAPVAATPAPAAPVPHAGAARKTAPSGSNPAGPARGFRVIVIRPRGRGDVSVRVYRGAPTPGVVPPPAAQPSAPRPPASARVGTPGGRWWIQVGSNRRRSESLRIWQYMRALRPGLLGQVPYRIDRVDLGARGTVYRVYLGPYREARAAQRFCRRLRRNQLGCLVVRRSAADAVAVKRVTRIAPSLVVRNAPPPRRARRPGPDTNATPISKKHPELRRSRGLPSLAE